MDELKKYLQNHADELNFDEPHPQVWANIERETAVPKKPATLIVFTRWAAAACILVLAGIGTWHMLNNKPEQPQLQAKTENKSTQPAPAQKEPAAETPDLSVIANLSPQKNTNKPLYPGKQQRSYRSTYQYRKQLYPGNKPAARKGKYHTHVC